MNPSSGASPVISVQDAHGMVVGTALVQTLLEMQTSSGMLLFAIANVLFFYIVALVMYRKKWFIRL